MNTKLASTMNVYRFHGSPHFVQSPFGDVTATFQDTMATDALAKCETMSPSDNLAVYGSVLMATWAIPSMTFLAVAPSRGPGSFWNMVAMGVTGLAMLTMTNGNNMLPSKPMRRYATTQTQ